jgi:hypothetical protein
VKYENLPIIGEMYRPEDYHETLDNLLECETAFWQRTQVPGV